MINKLMKMCLIVLVIREMQIVTTVIFHCAYPLESMNQDLITPTASEDKEQLGLLDTAAGVGMVPTLWKLVWQFLIKLSIHLP